MNPPSEIEALLLYLKNIQTRSMKFPPEPDHFFVDTGLFLAYAEKWQPDQKKTFVGSEFLGLYPLQEHLMLTFKISFVWPNRQELITTKAYGFTDLEGDSLYEALPSKGEPIAIEASIPGKFMQITDGEWKLNLMQGKYKEEFLPLFCHQWERD